MGVVTPFLLGLLLCLVQFVAALPWLAVLDLDTFRSTARRASAWGGALLGLVLAGVVVAVLFGIVQDEKTMLLWGRVYGAVLHVQLVVDLFVVLLGIGVAAPHIPIGRFKQALIWLGSTIVVLTLALYGFGRRARFLEQQYGYEILVGVDVLLILIFLLLIFLSWEGRQKMFAVALAAFREGLRQPMYWLLVLVGIGLMASSLVVPYFTFGEDAKMVKELGYDVIMLMALIFATLTASMSISEEIEGRTAITLMSKPVSRRQFLVGKFLGILLAAGVMSALLGWVFAWVIWLKPLYDPQSGDAPPPPTWFVSVQQDLLAWAGADGGPAINFGLGAALWLTEVAELLPGMILGFCQVSVLLALAVALATRLPMEVNLVTCAVIFVLGHLSHVLVLVSAGRNQFINVMARIFDTLLPGLEMLNLGPLISRDIPPPPRDFAIYIGYVVAYAVMYTVVEILLGLILFEDRDLA